MKENKTLHTKFGNAKIDHGYYRITSSKEGNHGKSLHRLIWEDFYGKIPDSCHIHHKDGNKLNNCIMNLQILPKSLHHSLHNNGENNPFYNQEHTQESKRKMSKKSKERWKDEEYCKKQGEAISKYTLWDTLCVYYSKNNMFQGGREPNPCKCFFYKYKGHHIPIGGFHDFLSVEIVNKLVEDIIKEI